MHAIGIDIGGTGVAGALVYEGASDPLRDKLEARLDLPIVIESDADAAGWAEFRYGTGCLHSDKVTLTIGTGVGGALAALRHLESELGQACASLGAVLDPQVFVFGGSCHYVVRQVAAFNWA